MRSSSPTAFGMTSIGWPCFKLCNEVRVYRYFHLIYGTRKSFSYSGIKAC